MSQFAHITTSSTRDEVTGDVRLTLAVNVDRDAMMAAALAGSGDDGLGDPTTSKGLQQVIFKGGEFVICRYEDAMGYARMDPDYLEMIDVAALRAAIRQVLN